VARQQLEALGPQPAGQFGRLFRPGGAVFRAADAGADVRLAANPIHQAFAAAGRPVRSLLAAPVVSRFGPVIGGLFCGHAEAGKFTERDERTLAGIASHAAIALDNARLLNEARQANAAKDQFLAVLSHELRTPLNPVLLTASMMANDATLPAEARANAEVIRRNVELEARLIDDMLDLTRISKGRIDLKQAVADVHTLLRHAAGMFEQELRGKGLMLTLDLAAARHHVRGDPARLQQVWWNLLKNAIKFTPPGGAVTVRTRNLPGGPAGEAFDGEFGAPPAELVVDVTDSGIGIDPGQIERLFHPFEQADRSIGRQYGGLGLGLAISRSLVEIHNGTLDATSAGPGRGATFTVRLPTTAAAAAGEAEAGLPAPRAEAAEGLRILVVEDHPDTARTMVTLLRTMGHTPTVATSVADGLRAAAAATYDLLLCDIGLPDGSGIDLLKQLPPDRTRRAVALTGYGMDEDVRRSLEAGFESHLTKPLNVERLVAMLDELGARAEQGQETPAC
jgi:signal transduction histidine kinase/CheY-like chemotaxis protein